MIHLMCRIFTLDSILEDNMFRIKWKLNHAPPSTQSLLAYPTPYRYQFDKFHKIRIFHVRDIDPSLNFPLTSFDAMTLYYDSWYLRVKAVNQKIPP